MRSARMAGCRIMARSVLPVMRPSRISTTRVGQRRIIDERVVAGDQDGFPLCLEGADDLHELAGKLGVQVGGRLIGDDDRRDC